MEEMPLFPIQTVVFPYSHLQIRVADQAQRDLIAYCSEEDRCFGTVLERIGTDPYLVGTAVRIERVIPADDGALDVQLRGQRRIRVRQFDDQSRTFLMAHVEPVIEMEIENQERADALTFRLRECFEEYLKIELQGTDIQFHGITFPDDPTALSFLAANLLPLDDLEKQRLLETTDTIERLATIVPVIQSQVEVRRTYRPTRASASILAEWVSRN